MDFTRGYDWEGEEKPAAMVFLKSKLRIRLTDPDKQPLSHAKCRVADDPDTVYDCDDDGVAEIPVKDGGQTSLDLEWGPADADGDGAFCWRGTFQLDVASADDDACRTRLTHLGFDGDTLADQVSAYQTHFGMDATGMLSDIRDQLVDWHDGGDYPGQNDPEPLSKIFDEGKNGSLTLKPAVRNHLQKLMDRLKDANGYRLLISTVTFVKKELPNDAVGHTVRDVVEISPKELEAEVKKQIYTLSHEVTHVLQFKVSPGDDDDAKWNSMVARYEKDKGKYGKEGQYSADDLQAIPIERIQVIDERFPMEAIARRIGIEGRESLYG